MDWFLQHAAEFVGSPVRQALLAALCTFILEDPTTVGCGLLVADGKMTYRTALVGVAMGIALGDLLLYLGGYALGPRLVRWGILHPVQVERAHRWFDRNIILAVLASRFIPGARLPAYVGAGMFQASFTRFVLVVVTASFFWTWGLLELTTRVGETIIPLLGRFKWPVLVFALGMMVTMQRLIARRSLRAGRPESTEGRDPVISSFELWPPVLFYAPVALYCVWLSLRYRGLTLPTAANPSIYSSGLVRESKSQILELLPGATRRWTAPWAVYDRPLEAGDPAELARAALERARAAGFGLPLVAKPDIGQRGAGVQRIDDARALGRYLATFPTGERVILQKLIDKPNEAGVLLVREPGGGDWRILSLTLKLFPEVVGDGRATLRELIHADERARLIEHVYHARHAAELERVLPAGERFALVFSGNHAQGTIFKDGAAHITGAMTDRFAALCREIPDFHFGRFDIRYDSLEALRRGEGFEIIELNGAGAEATHIWDSKMTLKKAYHALFAQFRLLYRIGAANRREGAPTTSLRQVLADLRHTRKLARQYPPTS